MISVVRLLLTNALIQRLETIQREKPIIVRLAPLNCEYNTHRYTTVDASNS